MAPMGDLFGASWYWQHVHDVWLRLRWARGEEESRWPPLLNEPEKDSGSHAKNLLQVPFYDAAVAPTGAGGAIRAGPPVIVG